MRLRVLRTLRIPIRAAAWPASSAHQPELQPSATCGTMPQIHQTGEAWCRGLQLPPESPRIRVLPLTSRRGYRHGTAHFLPQRRIQFWNALSSACEPGADSPLDVHASPPGRAAALEEPQLQPSHLEGFLPFAGYPGKEALRSNTQCRAAQTAAMIIGPSPEEDALAIDGARTQALPCLLPCFGTPFSAQEIS